MKTTVPSLLCLAAMAVFAATADAAGSKKGPKKFTPPPTPTPPGAPSADLAKFKSANLDRILGGLEVKTPLPRAELTQLKASFSQQFSKATLASRAQFQIALAVCDAMAEAMNEREKAMLNPAGSNWAQRSAQLRANIEQLMEREKAAETGAATPH